MANKTTISDNATICTIRVRWTDGTTKFATYERNEFDDAHFFIEAMRSMGARIEFNEVEFGEMGREQFIGLVAEVPKEAEA